MSFDKPTRNALARMVESCRTILTDDVRDQLQSVYGIYPNGQLLDIDSLEHLTAGQKSQTVQLREYLSHLISADPGKSFSAAYERMAREIAFTILNRFAALRMCEERGHIIECVHRGMESDGFRLYERLVGGSLGNRYETYRFFIKLMFREMSVDLGALFDQSDPQSVIFPSERCLEQVFALIDDVSIRDLWQEDETIGWVYQYFNPKSERDEMRKASSAPRNSRELAVRNQFFTPRYVVEFLTDNTLGRTWYEMRKGDTRLVDEYRYMVVRKSPVFLAPGEQPRQDTEPDITTEFIPHREKKDPRDIRILDPACGSGHFLLYAYDLLETIYEEAWQDDDSPAFSETGKRLKDEYQTLDDLKLALPDLILRHNLHGIDIDPRACQIAALALWLRVQRAYQKLGLKGADRPQITKSNIVTAEPMPGEADLLEEFCSDLRWGTLANIVREVFKKMELAGEAGSLLKIEEDIRDLIELAQQERRAEVERAKDKKGNELLFTQSDMDKMAGETQQRLFDAADKTDEELWQEMESHVLSALERYAEQVTNGHTLSRRLFASDAARGFAFIDLCRKRYDVVLMNPPFGDASATIQAYVEKQCLVWSKNLASAFVAMTTTRTVAGGLLGAVVDRTILIRNSYERFRRELLLDAIPLMGVADLGWEVLDASVEVSAIVVSSGNAGGCHYVFGVDLTNDKNKADRLLECTEVPDWRCLEYFDDTPYSAITFRLPEYLKHALANWPRMDEAVGAFFNGHTIKSDVLKRLVWELPLSSRGHSWSRMWNGSEYSPFYVSMVEATIVDDYAGGLNNHPSTILRNPDKHGRPGLCFGKRGDYLDVQVLPAGFILTNEGFGGPFPDNRDCWFLLAYLNSKPVQYALNFYSGQHKEVGYVNILPLPELTSDLVSQCSDLAKTAYLTARTLCQTYEVDPLFCTPWVWQHELQAKRSLQESAKAYCRECERLAELIGQIDEAVSALLGMRTVEVIEMNANTLARPDISARGRREENQGLYAAIGISYSLGCAFGRWDIRMALDSSLIPKLQDPFDPLPVCPPGMLVGTDGLPATVENIASSEWLRARENVLDKLDESQFRLPRARAQAEMYEAMPGVDQTEHEYYPMLVAWEGILVDDRDSKDDIIRRMREAFQLIWKDRAEAIEREACEILGVKTLRDYFRKPGGFFADHLKRYSKSRRQAPIYWPLSTASGSYTLWLYYPRLTSDTLYSAINNRLKPKIADVERRINAAESDLNLSSGSAGTKARDELDKAKAFLAELNDLMSEILRVAELPYKPDLNDGVIINAAPLHKLFRLPKWSKACEECWKKLEKGDYDWAHMALNVWPDRVKEVCKKDRSIAIAHDLEHLREVKEPKKAKRRKSSKAVENDNHDVEEDA
ncbi:MAG: BREX-1 system adenine-specific DNA-methyltransferase PglX [Armatimonadota bacterium]|nr:BREX-1 system adenine-specific DNA-methyltransferase PglX [bacterium]